MPQRRTLMSSQKDGFQITVETLPMKNKAIRVYFGKFQGRVTAKVIRMSRMMNIIKQCTPKGMLSADSGGKDRMPPNADQHQLGPYYHTIRFYTRHE
jgi:hypothetical protein